MNEYLDNLKNTQGKSPHKLSPAKKSTSLFPNISNYKNQSPSAQLVQIKSENIFFHEEQQPGGTDNEDDENEYLQKGDLKNLDKKNTQDSDDTISSSQSSSLADETTDNEDLIEAYSPQKIDNGHRSSSMSSRQSLAPKIGFKDLNNSFHYESRRLVTINEAGVVTKRSATIIQHTQNENNIYPLQPYQTSQNSKSVEWIILIQQIVDKVRPYFTRILIAFIVLCFLYNSELMSGSNKLKEKRLELQDGYSHNFDTYMKLLKSKYPSQTGLFWANIISTYQHTILRSKDPAIILIVSDNSTKTTASELTYDILNMIKKSIEETEERIFNLNDLVISPKSDPNLVDLIDGREADKVKLHIDTKLNRLFNNGQRIALVKNVDVIPATSMLLFYTYGDDLMSAKFPGVIILMTVQLDEIIQENYLKQKDVTSLVEKHLLETWSKDVGEDQLKPLFTRIANNVVLVRSEN